MKYIFILYVGFYLQIILILNKNVSRLKAYLLLNHKIVVKEEVIIYKSIKIYLYILYPFTFYIYFDYFDIKFIKN